MVVSTSRGRVVTTDQWFVVVIRRRSTSSGGASEGSIVTWANGVMVTRTTIASDNWNITTVHFRIPVASNTALLASALPELGLGSSTSSVAIGGAGTIFLLLVVVLSEGDLDDCRDDEEEGAEDGDSEAGGIQSACRTKGDSVGDLIALAA